MGKGAKKASKLLKPERLEKPKQFEKEEEPSAPQPPPPSIPSPIPEEAESGFAAQGSVHGNDQPFASDSWGTSADPAGTWHSSGNPSQVASPHLGDRKLAATPGPNSRVVSWAEQSTGGSYGHQHKYYPPSPHPGLDPASVDFERNVPRSNNESELDYVSEGPSGMGTNSNVGQHWDSAAQPQSQPGNPQEQRLPGPSSGPIFPVYATSLSNPPVAPNPLPTAPNVVSTASGAAARLDKGRRGDIPPPPPLPQPQYVPPSNSAAWHSWLKPDTYKPRVEQPAPPEVSPAPPTQVTASTYSGIPSSVPKGPPNPPRGVWEVRYSKGPWPHLPNGGAHGVGAGAGGAWNQPRSSAEGWAGYQGKVNYDGWNERGGEWVQANNGGGLDEGGKKGHGGSKSAGAWGGKRNVQWEEESDQEESDETEDDGWGEEGEGDDWEQADGLGNAGNQWGNAEGGMGGSGGTTWAKANNEWAAPGTGWAQEGWSQGVGARGAQQTGMHSWGENGRKGQGVISASLGAAGTRVAMSPQQRAQILNSLLNAGDQKQPGNATHSLQRSNKPMTMTGKSKREKENKRQTQYNAGWGLEDEPWGGEEENVKGDRTRSTSSKRASAAQDTWVGSQDASRYSMPSLTLAYAYKDSKTRLDSGSQNKLTDVTRMRFHESKGAALLPARNAFFSQTRLARDRLYWSFPPDKDERVRAALTWIQEMSYGLGTLGVHKFLQHRERGALVINADHKLTDGRNDFAVDYLIFDDLQKSFDKTLQSSVISYDPAVQVIVFVFLPSKSGNSIAIWRRKLTVPNNARLRFQNELDIALGGLKEPKEYVVYIDEALREKKDLPVPTEDGSKPKKKRKWWQFFKSRS